MFRTRATDKIPTESKTLTKFFALRQAKNQKQKLHENT